MSLKKFTLPPTVLLLGYGAIGRCFSKIVQRQFKDINLIVCDIFDLQEKDKKFNYIKKKINEKNLDELGNHLKKGDIIIDLSTNIDALSLWDYCMRNGINYVNSAMEDNEQAETLISFPKDLNEMYKASLGHRHDEAERSPIWNPKIGTTSVFEHGMNPGLISHFCKKGIVDAAEYFLKRKDWTDLNHEEISKYLNERNYPKLANAMGLHTIHCSEADNQYIDNPPKDLKTKFYNTWSCRGFLTESLVPIQVALGSHEDKQSTELPRLNDGKLAMSWAPACHYRAKSWLPFENIEGALIPHGEAYTITKFFRDKETGYSPSQYFVYRYNRYAEEFVSNLPRDMTLEKCNPECEVIHPSRYKIHGYNKAGAMMIFKNNRGWWSGSIMDEFDSSLLLDNQFGPTVIQVAGGVYSAFMWTICNNNAGNKWAEDLDSEFVLQHAKPYLGRIWSNYVDLSSTHLKDCYKFESFLTKKY